MYCLLLILTVVTSTLEHHSALLGLGHQENFVGNHQAATMKQSVSRNIRQTNVNEGKACSQTVYRAQCTGSYAQNYINTIGRCSGGYSAAVAAEGLCRQNENGDYCGTIGIDIANIVNAQRICSYRCLSSCRNTLISLKNRHGCCLRHNRITNGNTFRGYFGYCRISFPGYCPRTNLNIPTYSSYSTKSSCRSTTDLLKTGYSFACMRRNLQPTLNVLAASNCNAFVKLNEVRCSYRNGRFCWQSEFSSNRFVTALTKAEAICRSTTTCSSYCSRSIAEIKVTLGCCVNLHNTSLVAYEVMGVSYRYSTITSNNLWKVCGVTPPGLCQIKLSDSTTSLKSSIIVLCMMMVCCFFTFIAVIWN